MNIKGKLTGNGPRAIIAVVIVAVLAVGGYFVFAGGSSQKTVTARFTEAVGIYPGTPVDILGVPVGKVTKVQPGGDYVAITMSYDGSYDLPAKAGAVAVANSLVSDRYIQLTPVYRSGPKMASGATIPIARTGAPAELDDIYAALNKLNVALGPQGANKGGKKSGALNALLAVSAANLKGNGAALGNSLSKLSQAARTLADSRGNLFATVRNLQTFTTTLKGSDTQIRQFNQLLAQVSGDLAAERGDLGGALKLLGLALNDVQTFIHKNAGQFHTDVRGLSSILQTVVNNRASVQEALAVAPVALANVVHAYDPKTGSLGTRSNAASITDPKQLPQIICGLLGDEGGGTSGTTIGSVIGSLTGPLKGQVSKLCGSLAKSAGNVPNPASGNSSAPGVSTITGGQTSSGSSGSLPSILGGSQPQQSIDLPTIIGAGS